MRRTSAGKADGPQRLKEDQFKVSDGALAKIISGYTREAGVRGAQDREIARKAAREIYGGKSNTVDVTVRNLEKYLGKENTARIYAR